MQISWWISSPLLNQRIKIMTLLNFFQNLNSFSDWGGTSNTGIFNVETGYASLRSEWLPKCDCELTEYEAIQYLCKKCGINVENNITIQSGDGDGIYSVVTLLDTKARPFGALIDFDYNSEHAKALVKEIEYERARIFDGLQQFIKENLYCLQLGELKLDRDKRVLISDASAGSDSEYAVINTENWVSKRIRVVAFYEPSENSPHAQMAIRMGSKVENFTGGLENSIRPRILLAIADSYDFLLKDVVDMQLSESQWKAQVAAWKKQQCIGHVSPQSEFAIYWNARLENNFFAYSSDNNLAGEDEYLLRQYSWLLQGDSIGSQICTDEAEDMIKNSEGALAMPKYLRSALEMRGLFAAAKKV